MCRLLGLLGPPSASAEPWLLTTDHALLRQSDTSSTQLQADGWGVAWRDGSGAIQLEKGIRGAHEPSEVGRFREAAHRAHGPSVIAHLRKASNPLGLPRERLVALENSQPFVDATTIFAHNGAIHFPVETRPFLGRYQGSVRGVNDSEVLFYLLRHHLDDTGDPLLAYTRAVADLIAVWEAKGNPAAGPHSGLNVLFSPGPDDLWAFCHSLGQHGPALLAKERPYYELAYAARPTEVLVGSEPFDTTRSDWRSIVNDHYLHAHARHGTVEVRTGPIPLPKGLPILA